MARIRCALNREYEKEKTRDGEGSSVSWHAFLLLKKVCSSMRKTAQRTCQEKKSNILHTGSAIEAQAKRTHREGR